MAITKKTFDTKSYEFDRNGLKLSFEAGKFALQADGHVVVRLGDNIILCTASMAKPRNEDQDFLPLTIDRRDTFWSVGKIGGGLYRRREGKPSDMAVLMGRLTDRTLRPLFPKGMINDVMVTITPLNIDKTQDLGVLSIIAASVSAAAGGIPMTELAGAARIASVDGQLVVNPTVEQLSRADMNLIVAGPANRINMIECDAKMISDEIIDKAFALGIEEAKKSIEAQKKFLEQLTITPKTPSINKPGQALITYVTNLITEPQKQALFGGGKTDFNDLFNAYQDEILVLCAEKIGDASDTDFTASKVKQARFAAVKEMIRHRTMTEGKRVDDRTIDQVRPLRAEVGLMPNTHGTGLFRRGQTQVLTTTTLGGPSDYLIIDDMMEDEKHERYMHHYNFHSYTNNEAKPYRGVSRREVGHGYLAQKALEAVLPSRETFPYTIRTVSECMESSGSTSMASVCGSTLSLMDAGVPIIAPVSGIAMGMFTEHDDAGTITKYSVLTDLMGTEDFVGDMDFKIAGTREGITAIQLDTKISGLTMEMIQTTITQAHTARVDILDFMLSTAIATPRAQVSQHAPKIHVMHINPDKIKEVIGKGGEVIDKIIAAAGGTIKIDFEDDGTVFLTDKSQDAMDKAIQMIKDIAEDLELHQTYDGVVGRVEKYGIFVDLPKKKSGLLHISKLGLGKNIEDLNPYFKPGESIKVVIREIDAQGRLVLDKA